MVYFLGARPYDFTDDNGRQVTGVTVWFCDDEQDHASGVIPFKTSVSVEKFNAVFGGSKAADQMSFHPVNAVFNRKGKPESVTVIDTK